MPAARLRRPPPRWRHARCCSPTARTRSAKCPAIRPSAGWARAIWCARSTRWTGFMGRVADAAGIQFRHAQSPQGAGGAGPARPGRPQALPSRHAGGARRTSKSDHGRGAAEDLILTDGQSAAVSRATARSIGAGAVVLTTGTFLGGLIHIGRGKSRPAGSARRPRLGCRERFVALASPWGASRPARRRGWTADHRLGGSCRFSTATTRRCHSRF